MLKWIFVTYFGTMWLCPLTMWPSKLIVSCPCPTDHFQWRLNPSRCGRLNPKIECHDRVWEGVSPNPQKIKQQKRTGCDRLMTDYCEEASDGASLWCLSDWRLVTVMRPVTAPVCHVWVIDGWLLSGGQWLRQSVMFDWLTAGYCHEASDCASLWCLSDWRLVTVRRPVTAPVCADLQEAATRCLLANQRHSLNCAAEVRAFNQCVKTQGQVT